MTSPLAEFYSKPFSDHFMANLHDDDPDSLFVIRWKSEHFNKIKEFLKFTKRFASVLQFLGPEYHDEELSDYFSDPPSLDWETDYDFKHNPPQTKDLKLILAELFPEIEIPWLLVGQHTKTITLSSEDDKEFVSQGSSGFVHAFVAHDVYFEYE